MVNAAAGVRSVEVLPAIPANAPAIAASALGPVLGGTAGMAPLATLSPPPQIYVALQQREAHGELWLEIYLGRAVAAAGAAAAEGATAAAPASVVVGWAKRVGLASPRGDPFAREARMVPYVGGGGWLW